MSIGDCSACRSNIEKTNREISELENRDDLLKMCRVSLEGTKVTIYDISNRVGVITNIWQTVGKFLFA